MLDGFCEHTKGSEVFLYGVGKKSVMLEKRMQALQTRLRGLWRRLLRPRTVRNHGVFLNATSPLISKTIRRSIYEGGYESKECQLLSETLESDDRVLELGAGLGFIGAFCCRRLGSGARVCCVEANPALKPLAQETFALNNVQPVFVNAAVALENGKQTLHVPDNFWSASTVCDMTGATGVDVPTVSLQSLLDDFRPTFLIVDIEGAECALLRHPLPGVKKICVEVHPHVTGDMAISDMVASLHSHNFIVDYRRSTPAVLFLRKRVADTR